MSRTTPTLWETARFELALQIRRRTTWIIFGLFLIPLIGVTSDRLARAAGQEVAFNTPLAVAMGSGVMGLVAVILLAVVVGDAATRDIGTRIEPLMHAAPVTRATYLGGRFLGAFIVAAVLMGVVLLAQILVPLAQPQLAAEVLGPFRAAAYLQAYFLLLLPNAFVAVAVLFAAAIMARHPLASWAGAAVMIAASQLSRLYFGDLRGRWDLAQALDPTGITPVEVMARAWTPLELSQRLIASESVLLGNRALWLVIAGLLLLLAYRRFDFGANAGDVRWWQRGPLRPRRSVHGTAGRATTTSAPREGTGQSAPVAVPRAPRDLGATGRVRQTLTVTLDSLREMVPVWVWPAVPLLMWAQMGTTSGTLGSMGPGTPGTPVLPTTDLVLQTLLGPNTLDDMAPPIILAMILLPALLAGELVWRERDANMEALADAAPVSDGVRFVGKLSALWLVLLGLYALLVLGAVLAQVRLGWHDLQPGLYLRVMALRLVMPLAYGLFALSVHVLVNQKYVASVLVLLLVTPLIGELLGIEHPLLLLGFVPAWRYSPISGFEPFLGSVLWIQLYWIAWALLLALVARLFWVRGVARGFGGRLRLAWSRLTKPGVMTLGAAAGLVLMTGGFVFYNTNVLNPYRTSAERDDRRAEYERLYGGFAEAPQPRLVATELEVEIHPERRAADIHGVHHLVNETALPLDTLHVATSPEVETREVELDRPARAALVDDDLGHRVYVLDEPLPPGGSLRLEWDVRHAPRGFPADGVSRAIVGNGSFFVARDWIPLVGYQRDRQLADPLARRDHGLPPWSPVPSLDDPEAPYDRYGRDAINLAVTVSTSADQLGVGPGRQVRTWMEDGRRYARYETNAAIGNGYAVFSADYVVDSAGWDDVALEVVHHPGHDTTVPTMIRSMRASLEQFTERFGPFPYDVIRMVEYPSEGGSLHAASATIWYQELFSLFDADRDPRRVDLPFAVVAHEVAHQFQPVPARMEGQALLSESFAWYAAMGVIEEEYGAAHLARFLDFMRTSYLTPRSRADVPLLRANDSFLAYRKGPFAMYALREYVGQDRVDLAWRRLRETAADGPPFATSLDLYRELQAVTPDSLHTLLGDLLERNTFWELTTGRASAEPTPDGRWRVTLEVEARKVSVDTVGVETEMPMDGPVEFGVYPPEAVADGAEAGAPPYLEVHRVRSGPQAITITVPARPARAGIDPRYLLIDLTPSDNVVDIPESSAGRS